MSKLILLNGPEGCGKSVLCEDLATSYSPERVRYSLCKEKLFELTISLFNLTRKDFFEMYNNREQKESPQKCFKVGWLPAHQLFHVLRDKKIFQAPADSENKSFYLTVRHAMIYVSEVVIKPQFGVDYFGVCRAKKIRESEGNLLFLDDSCFGTMDEIQPAIDILGEDNVLCIRIFGRGEFSSNDSRKYLEDGSIKNMVDIVNDGSLPDFISKAKQEISKFTKGDF